MRDDLCVHLFSRLNFCKSSGGVARHILQQLQTMNIVDIDTKGGRKITSSGQRDLTKLREGLQLTFKSNHNNIWVKVYV
ncbi:Small ribosomal subunit protein eS19x [Cardamine amara subsp. amara]|uniref:Small ribosomal subunit protein eS19x n=1 Tax=Cardamine amara subsp. amara TaxID=228776 RepID=A0ABD1B833_CARAN